jgi:hypothetical protein
VVRALLIAFIVVVLGACGTSLAPSPQSPGATLAPAPAMSGEVPSAPAGSATPSGEAPRAALVLGCISIDDPECQFLARQIVAVLPPERGPAFAVGIQLFECENPDAPCPKSLSARVGKAVVEFLDGEEPLELSLAGPPLTPEIAPQDAFYLGLSHPSSARVAGGGPFPFEVGHCGLSHVIDFDGSYWVPVGQVDGDHPTIINAEAGSMRLIAPSLAEFRGDSGFTAQLARFPGPKHFWGCD